MKKGFTLIELLVVIAIIGILASIVLVALGSARNKAKDAAIKADLSSLRPAAEMWASDNSEVYTGFCAGADATRIGTAVSDAGGGTLTCYDDANEWCSSVAALPGAGGSWCVDWQGFAGVGTGCTNIDNQIDCP